LKPKVQSNTAKIDELRKSDNTTVIFGLAMTAIFVAMLILNALS
jgi:orotate phosphoribosyltransferase